MIDRLPTPFGLVRAGVAPDHPKIKNVIKRYEKTAGHEAYRFFGHVTVGRDITADELAEHYHAVIWAYGAGADRKLGIDGRGSARLACRHRIRRLVQRPSRLRRPQLRPRLRARRRDRQRQRRRRRRPDARPPPRGARVHRHRPLRDRGAGRRPAVEEVLVLGRRGPAQAAFTNPEVRELGELTRRRRDRRSRAAVDLDEAERAFLDSDAADMHQPQEHGELHRLRRRSSRGQAEAGRAAVPPQPARDPGRRQGRADRRRRQRALHRRVRRRPGPHHRRDRDDRVRDGPALDRLPRHRASTAFPTTPRPASSPTTAGG